MSQAEGTAYAKAVMREAREDWSLYSGDGVLWAHLSLMSNQWGNGKGGSCPKGKLRSFTRWNGRWAGKPKYIQFKISLLGLGISKQRFATLFQLQHSYWKGVYAWTQTCPTWFKFLLSNNWFLPLGSLLGIQRWIFEDTFGWRNKTQLTWLRIFGYLI